MPQSEEGFFSSFFIVSDLRRPLQWPRDRVSAVRMSGCGFHHMKGCKHAIQCLGLKGRISELKLTGEQRRNFTSSEM